MRMGGFSWLSRRGGAPVTLLTLSSATKATLFRIMLWRCWASSEHGIARLGTCDLQLRGYSASGLKFGRACGRATIACPVPSHTERAFAQGPIGEVWCSDCWLRSLIPAGDVQVVVLASGGSA